MNFLGALSEQALDVIGRLAQQATTPTKATAFVEAVREFFALIEAAKKAFKEGESAESTIERTKQAQHQLQQLLVMSDHAADQALVDRFSGKE